MRSAKLAPAIGLFALPILATSVASLAASKGGINMPDTVTVAGKTLHLNGLGIREATIFKVDVYVAGLYLETRSKDSQAIIEGEQVKRIVMKFVRDVDRDDMIEAWNSGFGSGKALADRLKQLNGYMADIPQGQTMVVTYLPGAGTEVSVNGKVKGTIPGADFAAALFRIWLGPKPPNKGLRDGMLGRG